LLSWRKGSNKDEQEREKEAERHLQDAPKVTGGTGFSRVLHSPWVRDRGKGDDLS